MTRNGGQAASIEEQLVAGRYRIERLLGKGGMGAVYAAFDNSTGARVAVKRTLAAASPKVRELFRREFHTLHGLRHPNIIEVYDCGSDAEGSFYTIRSNFSLSLAPLVPRLQHSGSRKSTFVAGIAGLLYLQGQGGR